MTSYVWIYVDASRARPWCVVVKAHPGGRIVTGCSSIPYREALISTGEPHGLCCAACLERVAAGLREPAAALAEPEDDDLAISRTATVDIALRPRRDPPEAWTSQWEPPSKEHR